MSVTVMFLNRAGNIKVKKYFDFQIPIILANMSARVHVFSVITYKQNKWKPNKKIFCSTFFFKKGVSNHFKIL